MAAPAEGGGVPLTGRVDLTPEEMRSLLSDADNGADEAPSPGDRMEAARLLLVSRDEEEIRLVRGVLGGLKLEVAVVGNPFGALDQLRLRRYAGVISDFDLWAEGGRLLFERLGASGSRSPVVFICSTGEAALRARAAGAVDALRRPLGAQDLALAARAFLPSGEGQAAASSGAAVRPRAPAEAPREVSWLRLFFEARRSFRSLEPGRARLAALLSALSREIGWEDCGVGVALDDGWWILVRPGARDVLVPLGQALEAAGAGSPGGAPAPPGEVRVDFAAGGRPAVFIARARGRSAEAESSARVPGKFLEELSILLGETGSAVR